MDDVYTVRVFNPEGDLVDEDHVQLGDGWSVLRTHLYASQVGLDILDMIREDRAERRRNGLL